MSTQSKNNLLSKRNIRIALGFVVVALVAGVYFLFKPFPAGPSLEAAAAVKDAGSLNRYEGHGYPSVLVKEAASVNGWSAYANPAAASTLKFPAGQSSG